MLPGLFAPVNIEACVPMHVCGCVNVRVAGCICYVEKMYVCGCCGGSRGGSEGSVEPPFGSLISMKNTDLNVYFCSKVPFRESTNPPSNPPSQNPGSAPGVCECESSWVHVLCGEDVCMYCVGV